MNLDKEAYAQYAKQHAPKSPISKNCLHAALFGGCVCTLGEMLYKIFYEILSIEEKSAGTLVSVSLIFLASFLTGIGVFDKIAKIAGAGTLVPITGFSNSVTAPAIDNKAEGFVLGVGAKMFTIAGPVIVYGTVASVVYGVIYWITTLF